MHEGLQTELRPENPYEDSLRGEALRVSPVQGPLQRPETFASAHDQCAWQWGALKQDALIDPSILYVLK